MTSNSLPDKTPNFRKPFERLSNINECRVIEVIEVKSIVGEGDTIGTPKRQITEYYSTDGTLLARRDILLDGELMLGVWSDES